MPAHQPRSPNLEMKPVPSPRWSRAGRQIQIYMWPMSTRYQKHDTGARLISNDGFLMGYVKVKCRKWNENSAGSNSQQPQTKSVLDVNGLRCGSPQCSFQHRSPRDCSVFSNDDSNRTSDTVDHGPASQAHRYAASRLTRPLGSSGRDADLLDAVAPGDGQRGRAAASVTAIAEHLFNRKIVFVTLEGQNSQSYPSPPAASTASADRAPASESRPDPGGPDRS